MTSIARVDATVARVWSMIAIVLPDLRGGGAERVSVDLGRALARRGHRVEFVLQTASGDLLAETRSEFKVVDLGVNRLRKSFGPLVSYFRKEQPAAVLAMMWPLTFLVPLAARMAGVRGKVGVAEHGVLSLQYATWGWLNMFLLRFTTMIGYRLAVPIGVSRGVAGDMSGLARLGPERVVTIHNPVRFLPEPDAAALADAQQVWKTAGPRILTVGSFKRVKNQTLLLRSFARFARSDAQLVLLGQGPEEETLRALARSLGISGRVSFAGFRANPSAFYATADLFVLSSDSEGFGNVIVEALFHGLRVVSTDCPYGPSEILDGGRFGRLVHVGDEMALAKAMEAALAETPDPASLRRRAETFSADIAAAKYLAALGM